MAVLPINRRTLIRLLGISGLSAQHSWAAQAAKPLQQATQPRWVSASGATKEQFGISWAGQSHKLQTAHSDFRGHDVAAHPLRPNHALLFGRRPATQAIEVDLANGTITHSFECAPNRHLFGHGCFSANGQQLFTAEGNIENGTGKIVVRDSQTYQQLAEFNSGGIGPHQLKLMPNGKTLVVANGGIRTHPSSGRKKLNLTTMNSCLSYIDSQTGQVLNSLRVSESKASIRHLDVHPDGTVAIAMQVQREACNHNRAVPLAAIHKPHAATLTLLEQPQTLITQMQDYIGSVAIHAEQCIAGFTSPKGNVAAFWSTDNARFLGYHRLHDVCGIAVTPDNKHFLLSNSAGEIRFITAKTLTEQKSMRRHYPNTQWDNHLLMI